MKLVSPLHTIQSYKHIFRRAAGTLALRIFAAVLTLLLLAVLARILGVADYGTYTYALSWVYLLATPTCLGIDRLLVRLVAVYHSQDRWDLVRGILRWSNQRVLGASLLLVIIGGGVSFLFSPSTTPITRNTFLILLVGLPFLALTMLKQSALQGIQHVLRGQLPELLFRPLSMLGLVVLFYLASDIRLSATYAAGMTVIASAAAYLAAGKLLIDKLPPTISARPSQSQKEDWTHHARPLLLVGALSIISLQAETIILGALKGMEAVGYFTVASRAAELISLALLIMIIPLAPTYARLWFSKDTKELERVAKLGTNTSLMLALPIALALIFYGPWFLSFFGPEFIKAQPTLEVLSIGHIINVMMGSVEVLLVMSGYEREVAIRTAGSIVIKILLCMFLIPRWGVVGAAIARSGSLIAWNLLLLHSVHKKLGINPSVFGRFRLTGRNRT